MLLPSCADLPLSSIYNVITEPFATEHYSSVLPSTSYWLSKFFFLLPLHFYFFYPSCRPPSSSKWYFLLSLLFIFIPTSVFSSSSIFSVKTHLFLSCRCSFFSSLLSVVYCGRTISFLLSLLPCVLICRYFFLPCLLFSHSCCLRIILFITIFNRCNRIIYLLFRIYFLPSHSLLLLLCMWLFLSLYPFFCPALVTPLLSCHHFSVMSPRLLPLLSCCVILRSRKQTFPPRLPCTDLSEWSRETITSRATRVLVLSDHQRSWRHALIVLDKTMELLVLRYTLSHVVGSSSIVEVGAQRLRSYRVQ